jgi:hypothetical protein
MSSRPIAASSQREVKRATGDHFSWRLIQSPESVIFSILNLKV